MRPNLAFQFFALSSQWERLAFWALPGCNSGLAPYVVLQAVEHGLRQRLQVDDSPRGTHERAVGLVQAIGLPFFAAEGLDHADAGHQLEQHVGDVRALLLALSGCVSMKVRPPIPEKYPRASRQLPVRVEVYVPGQGLATAGGGSMSGAFVRAVERSRGWEIA